jgi:hypothetical protein
VDVLDVREHVGVHHDHAPGMSGRAARVDERQRRIRIVDRLRRVVAPHVQRVLIDHHLPGQGDARRPPQVRRPP